MKHKRQHKKQAKKIWAWYESERQNEALSPRVLFALRWFAKNEPMEDYGYIGGWREHLEYCSDRMNGGRAKAILRLYKNSLTSIDKRK